MFPPYPVCFRNKRFGFTVCSQYSSTTPYSIPNTGDIWSPRRQLTPNKDAIPIVTRSKAVAYDTRCTDIISRLDQIFDRPLIVKILMEKKTCDLYAILNLYA
ncbi:hypothetical protein DINM_004090 [Dirofilaria immitis]|nr:hypothetical protein [Dirofilaria immitis]